MGLYGIPRKKVTVVVKKMKMIISHWILWVNSTHFVDATCSEVD
jgi:hypothetical protein